MALTSPTSGGRSVGIVRSRTKATKISETVDIITFYVYLFCKILSFRATSCFINPHYRLVVMTSPSYAGLEMVYCRCQTAKHFYISYMGWRRLTDIKEDLDYNNLGFIAENYVNLMSITIPLDVI
jgi:hypothetical protein